MFSGKFASVSTVLTLQTIAQGSVCRTCDDKEFQPVAMYSYEFLRPACQMKRTVCEDYDAMTIETGNASMDDICTCDLLQGYRPVNVAGPKYNCSTFNASSGCRCIHQPCPEGQLLDPKGKGFQLPFPSVLHRK